MKMIKHGIFLILKPNFVRISGVVMDGKDRCVINAKYILDVDMAIAMEVLGSVFVTLTGVAFYAIKVSALNLN